MEPRHLPPSLRANKRYIIYKIISEYPVSYNDFISALWQSMVEFLGELESSNVKLWPIQNLYNPRKQIGVLKCRHDRVEHLRAVISLIMMIGESRSIVHIMGVTGTIKSAQTKYLD